MHAIKLSKLLYQKKTN